MKNSPIEFLQGLLLAAFLLFQMAIAAGFMWIGFRGFLSLLRFIF